MRRLRNLLCTERQTKPRVLSAFFLTALLFAVVCGTARAAEITDLPDTLKADPMNGRWKERILPHQRLVTVTPSYEYWNVVFDYATVVLPRGVVSTKVFESYDEATGKTGEFSAGYGCGGGTPPSNFHYNSEPAYVFASAVTEGVVPDRTVTLPEGEDFYGATTFEGLPRNVIVSSYLVQNGYSEPSIYIGMRSEDDANPLGLYELPTSYCRPAYQIEYKGDGSWRTAPHFRATTMHDIVAHDWNGDGYSDYVLTYVKSISRGDVLVKLLLVDGRSLYERLKNGTGDVIMTHVNGDDDVSSKFITGSSVTGGLEPVRPANSIRIAKADTDGDGTPEIALYYTLIHGNGANESRANQLELYKIDFADGAYRFSGLYSSPGGTADGKSLLQHNTLGVGGGDINGDGRDEIVLVYIDSASSVADNMGDVRMCIYNFDNGQMIRRVPSGGSVLTSTFGSNNAHDSVPPVEVQVADVDGDGLDEVVWSTGDDDGGREVKIFVHDWEIAAGGEITDTGTKYEYEMVNVAGLQGGGRTASEDRRWHSLTTGVFKYPDDGGLTRRYIGLAYAANDSAVETALFSWSKQGGLVLEKSYGVSGTRQYIDTCPRIAAVDFYGESVVYGAPTVITVEDNIELMAVTQAPPKHWDKVSAKGSALADSESVDEDGNIVLDAFAVFDTEEYYTGMELNQSSGTTTSTTAVSEGGCEVGGSLSRSKMRFNIKEKFSPSLEASAEYARREVHNHTDGYSSTLSYTFQYKANRDDQLYYKSNNYNLCRYPVLLPESKRYTTVITEDGTEEQMQTYVQFVVPTSNNSTFTPTPGRSISWYEPLHDNYNLFTYPKRVQDIKGYPQGTDAKLDADEFDPWADFNGKEFVHGTNNIIGNPDSSAFTMTASMSGSSEDYDSIRNTLSGAVHKHFYLGSWLFRNRHQTLDLSGDGSWGTDSTTSTDASRMMSVTVNWPGAASYSYFTDEWTARDMQFRSDAAYYTQDDGALCVGFAIPSLKQMDSKIWGAGSPYSTHADPGLLLPFRWNNDIKNEISDTNMKTAIFYLSENDSPYSSHQMKGVTFTELESNDDAADASYEGLTAKVLETGAKYRAKVRVINYSFIDAYDIGVKVYYQPWKDGSDNIPSANPAGDCEQITDEHISMIPGRSSSSDTSDNWLDMAFEFTAPETPQLGWLHVVLEPSGEELNAGNNHGWALIGMYDPSDFEYTLESGAGTLGQAAGTKAASAAEIAEYPNLSVKDIKAYEIITDEDGDVTYKETKLDESSRYMKLRIDATVSFEGGNVYIGDEAREINYLPAVRCALFAGDGRGHNAILGAQERPIVKEGEDYTVSFTYDPELCPAWCGVAVRAFSPFLQAANQSDPESQSAQLWHAQTGGSGGGCSAGWGALAMLAVVPLALLRRKK